MGRRDKDEWLRVDDGQAVVVRMLNKLDDKTGEPVYRIGYRCWLVKRYDDEQKWNAALLKMKRDKRHIKMMWPKGMNVKGAKETLRELAGKEFESTVVQLEAYGERSLMVQKLSNLLKYGKSSPKKEDRQFAARKKLWPDENDIVDKQTGGKKKGGKEKEKSKKPVKKITDEDRRVALEKLQKAINARQAFSEVENDSTKNSDSPQKLVLGGNCVGQVAGPSMMNQNEAGAGPVRKAKNDTEMQVIANALPSDYSVQQSDTQSTPKRPSESLGSCKIDMIPSSSEGEGSGDEATPMVQSSAMGTEESSPVPTVSSLGALVLGHPLTPAKIQDEARSEPVEKVESGKGREASSDGGSSTPPMNGELESVVQPSQQKLLKTISPATGSGTADETRMRLDAGAGTSENDDYSIMSVQELREELRRKDKELERMSAEADNWRSKYFEFVDSFKRCGGKIMECLETTSALTGAENCTPQDDASSSESTPNSSSGGKNDVGGKKRKREEAATTQVVKRRKIFPIPSNFVLSREIKAICDNPKLTVRQVVIETLPLLFDAQELRTSCIFGSRSRDPNSVPGPQKPRGPPLDREKVNALINRCYKNFKKDPKWYDRFKGAAKYKMGLYRAKGDGDGQSARQNNGQNDERDAGEDDDEDDDEDVTEE